MKRTSKSSKRTTSLAVSRCNSRTRVPSSSLLGAKRRSANTRSVCVCFSMYSQHEDTSESLFSGVGWVGDKKIF